MFKLVALILWLKITRDPKKRLHIKNRLTVHKILQKRDPLDW